MSSICLKDYIVQILIPTDYTLLMSHPELLQCLSGYFLCNCSDFVTNKNFQIVRCEHKKNSSLNFKKIFRLFLSGSCYWIIRQWLCLSSPAFRTIKKNFSYRYRLLLWVSNKMISRDNHTHMCVCVCAYLISSFNSISTFVGNLMPKPSL